MGGRWLLVSLAAGLLAGCGAAPAQVPMPSPTMAPEPTTRADCERVGGTWHYDSDLADVMSKHRPRPKPKAKTTSKPRSVARSGEWECDGYPGDDDDD